MEKPYKWPEEEVGMCWWCVYIMFYEVLSKCVRVYVSTCKCVSEYNSEYWCSRWGSSRWCGVLGPLQPPWALCCDAAWQRREFMCLTKTFNTLANSLTTHNYPSLKQRLKTCTTTARQTLPHTDRSSRLDSLSLDYCRADVCCPSG